MKSFALALGGGGARGLAHIPVLEALDEAGAKPAAIAATSSGALIAAAYAAGMSGREIRRFVITLAHDRTDVFRRLIASRASTFANLLNFGLGSATLLDAEKFCQQFFLLVILPIVIKFLQRSFFFVEQTRVNEFVLF